VIRVAEQPEPLNFDATVRQPGLSAIAEMVGEPQAPTRPGPRREQRAASREQLKSDDFPPFWRRCLNELWEAYGGVCSYTCLRIPRATGAPSVDHYYPVKAGWRGVYEWPNYRLACALVNSEKGAVGVLDPFAVEDSWFELEFVAGQVLAAVGLSETVRDSVLDTIEKLGLNSPAFCAARNEVVQFYRDHDFSYQHLRRFYPFIARELQRQSRLLEADQ
jgi:hypothetical protein